MEKVREFTAAAIVILAIASPFLILINSDGKSMEAADEIVVKAYLPESGGFKPNHIVIPQGSKVRLIVKAVDVTHGIAIPSLGINEIIPAGEEVIIEFVAERKGTYYFMCSVYCSPYHRLMRGMIVVV